MGPVLRKKTNKQPKQLPIFLFIFFQNHIKQDPIIQNNGFLPSPEKRTH